LQKKTGGPLVSVQRTALYQDQFAESPITNAAIAAIRLVIYVIETHLPSMRSPFWGVHHLQVGSALDVLTTPPLVSSPL